MIKLEIPFWQNGPTLTGLRDAAQRFWEQVEGWLRWPLAQFDPETCTLGVLQLIAWQRDIRRFSGESETLFRLRVKYAYANARDAGSKAGFARIFQRLGIGELEQLERQAERDWDWITLVLSEQQIADHPELVEVIVQQYGRTCRRYELLSVTTAGLVLRAAAFDNDQQTVLASRELTAAARWAVTAEQFDNDQATVTAVAAPPAANWATTVNTFDNDQQTALATLEN